MSVTIVGPDVMALIRQANKGIIDQSESALDNVADYTQSDAKDNCPVDTGDLQDDIIVYAIPLQRDIGNNIYYCEYVHEGTYKMAARPYLFNAFEANRDRLISDLQAIKV